MSTKSDIDFEIGFLESLHKRMQTDATVVEMLANVYTEVGRIDEGLEMDLKHVELEPENPTAHYNLACSLALKSFRIEALDSLRTALEMGFNDFSWMLKDPDLKSLSNDDGFHALLEEFRS
jgi:hypothetical protein